MNSSLPDAQTILTAAERIRPYIHRTPLLTSRYFDEETGRQLFFKCENFQKAGAFKSRGACNAVFSLSGDELHYGVATHSSGNHAQALARAAALRGMKSYIVMPENSSLVKIEAVRAYGGDIHFCAPTLQAREATLAKVVAETGAIEIHPYNNYTIIAGQATAAFEVFEAQPDTELLLVPVGGGGLLSGSLLSAVHFGKSCDVIAVEPENARDAYLSFQSGSFVPSENPDTIADGLRTSLGSLTWPIIKQHVTDVVTVSEGGIIHAMKRVWERMKIIIEPSSAVVLAALLEQKIPEHYQKVVLIFSGGNVDLDHLPWIPKIR